MEQYSFEQLWKELNDGYSIYYTYMEKRYILTKLDKNCYSNELADKDEKGPHPKSQIVTLKTVKELFEFMEDIEYKINL